MVPRNKNSLAELYAKIESISDKSKTTKEMLASIAKKRK